MPKLLVLLLVTGLVLASCGGKLSAEHEGAGQADTLEEFYKDPRSWVYF